MQGRSGVQERQLSMAKTAKKVVLFIVEGPTDEDAFSSVMKKLHARQQVVFLVIHGDITTDRDVNARNALAAVNQKIKELMRKYGLHRTDLLKIIHLVDMDGAYVPETAIRYGDTDKLMYGLDEIYAPKGNHIVERNRNKACIINRLCTTHEISSVPYGLYYLSRNMEHVLFDDMGDLSDEQKMDYADSFADRYGEDPIGFVAFMSKSAFAVSGSYRETWLFIKKGTNSLHRWSNLHLALPATSAEEHLKDAEHL